ncbi:hypothetical protein O3M35_012586 [Rhynocoris fuscipes]|uniref:Uncharacterized protein n=1 Tax=Rhynocoris fuscipes TaxID=488301 RepID=A0AAW1CUI0_9HEMI
MAADLSVGVRWNCGQSCGSTKAQLRRGFNQPVVIYRCWWTRASSDEHPIQQDCNSDLSSLKPEDLLTESSEIKRNLQHQTVRINKIS